MSALLTNITFMAVVFCMAVTAYVCAVAIKSYVIGLSRKRLEKWHRRRQLWIFDKAMGEMYAASVARDHRRLHWAVGRQVRALSELHLLGDGEEVLDTPSSEWTRDSVKQALVEEQVEIAYRMYGEI